MSVITRERDRHHVVAITLKAANSNWRSQWISLIEQH